ncbi:tRNA/rRNA methyltransferase (SpoU) [Desulfovibrio sp. X2]|uniref:RNA methyltransferase n=1 Tax=Desulfovibrio sp. X2 TaxID=941449 RepID=UPI00035888B3|nr:RNA methyltransferase [Desulfovibrio sp. X2]EPR37638.1 tRNA/rRNA methyltransferase (SpoU) [Desulfovibrio sp. X2]
MTRRDDAIELAGLAVVLVGTRFPENVGAVARACLNMGADDIRLVSPEMWDIEKAAPMATVHARHLLEAVRLFPDLPSALADCREAYATTARLGGWRRAPEMPDEAAESVARSLAAGDRVALVFGPEDKGLSNEDTSRCTHLVTVPTASQGRSLNLAQATLLLLWECLCARRAQAREADEAAEAAAPRTISMKERELLVERVKEAMLALDVLHGDNPDYFLLPMRRLLARASVTRREFDMLMGICRQIGWLAARAKGQDAPS